MQLHLENSNISAVMSERIPTILKQRKLADMEQQAAETGLIFSEGQPGIVNCSFRKGATLQSVVPYLLENNIQAVNLEAADLVLFKPNHPANGPMVDAWIRALTAPAKDLRRAQAQDRIRQEFMGIPTDEIADALDRLAQIAEQLAAPQPGSHDAVEFERRAAEEMGLGTVPKTQHEIYEEHRLRNEAALEARARAQGFTADEDEPQHPVDGLGIGDIGG